jgi:two-component system response regulator PilR (NtrC family)
MNIPWEILVASSDLEGRRTLSNILAKLGVDPLTSSTVRECKELIATERVGLIFCDRLLTDGNCHDLLSASRGARTKTRVVVMSSTADWDEFLEAMRLGAFDVIASPCRATDVEWMIIQALRYERTESRLALKTQATAAGSSQNAA